MKLQSGLDYFWPYDSLSDIYKDRIQAEFGLTESKWQFDLPVWRFFYGENRDLIPPDFALPNCADHHWDQVSLPSLWQQEGYGLPNNLEYDSVSKSSGNSLKRQLQAKFNTLTSSAEEDDVGVYRTWLSVSPDYLERAVYFSCSGICGRFEIYVNGRLVVISPAINTMQKILLSSFLHQGENLIAILVYRLNSDKRGRIRKENGTFGFGGIFRMPKIVAESLVELANISISTSWADLDSGFTPNNPLGLETALDETQMSDNFLSPDLPEMDSQALAQSVNNLGERRDSQVNFRLTLMNHVDLLIPVMVEYVLYEARSEYDLYHLPTHPIRVTEPIKASLTALMETVLEGEFYAPQVWPWSDQTPSLYDLIITIKDVHDRIICVKRQRFGFRRTEVIARIFHINDVALPLRTVRYFNFDATGALAVPLDRFRQDIQLMKQANINTIIVAHFPADSLFYMVCDHYGMYVISQGEANNMATMIKCLSTHPSIAFWSFSPRRYDEGKLWELKQQLLLMDRTRPFYCEHDRTGKLSDILPLPCEAGTLFGEWTDLCIDQSSLRPSPISQTRSDIKLSGLPLKKEALKNFRWLHQGDLEEYHEKMDVPIAQGIISADRIPHPVYFEVKKQCETLRFISEQDNPAHLSLQNLHPLGETPPLLLYWQLLLGGLKIRGGHGELGILLPLAEKALRFPFSVSEYMTSNWLRDDKDLLKIYNHAICHELILDIRICTAEDTTYALAGHEMAFYQQILLEKVAGPNNSTQHPSIDEAAGSTQSLAVVSNGLAVGGTDLGQTPRKPLAVNTCPTLLTVEQSAVAVSFSRSSGGLKSFIFGDKELLGGSLQPSFYRAATNGDRSDQSFILASTVFSKETDWRTIQHDLRYQRFHYEMVKDEFSMISHYKSFAFKGEVLVQYLMNPTGRLKVSLAFTPKYDLLRSGFRVLIPNTMQNLSWYGRGLHEAYPDRKESARIGYYVATPEDLYYEYARPQENGGHCDTKCLILSDGMGKGVKITSANGEGFSFTAALYSPEEMDDHQHQEQLVKKDTYELFLDFYQRGIERTGEEVIHFVKNQTHRGTFIFEAWHEDESNF